MKNSKWYSYFEEERINKKLIITLHDSFNFYLKRFFFFFIEPVNFE